VIHDITVINTYAYMSVVCSCGWSAQGRDVTAAADAHLAEARARRDHAERRITDTLGDPDAPLTEL
jgi:hypothetical protein